ncbi:DUF6172 family protein [Aestuariirhabdus litorea]|uniref:Uncharacterized protein n=1 Tax=Aestuariirhabdus litorea TaxID=2528527 RepID=A0A3P3VLT5_9GAMM|nr:DUF6172 family protein [Aestuariirhabdus litorea]RRJ83384.1 hypothetical protein D0544_16335 [Aestuariirhabdus litorea]RWW93543.1 hypothetical protein DZC74_16305 [Endozoicomonadaceae bacterium GTF-13]
MKKTFSLTHSTIKYPRLIEAVKHEVKKYLKRERNKALPAGADYWAFDCRIGATEAEAEAIHVAEINKRIDGVEQQQLTAFYLEILARPAQRQPREPLADAPLQEGSAPDAEE